MTIWLNRMLGRKYSVADLELAAGTLLDKPPAPPDLLITLHGVRAPNGMSVVDVWRRDFRALLAEIAAEPLWRRQREVLLRAITEENRWHSVYLVAKEARHSRSWAHYVKDAGFMDEESPLDALYIRYVIAVLTTVSLESVARKLFAFEEMTELQLGLIRTFGKSIMETEVCVSDYMFDLVQEDDEVGASEVATFKDNVVNPFLVDQFALQSWMADGIATDTFELATVREQLHKVEQRREAIIAELARP